MSKQVINDPHGQMMACGPLSSQAEPLVRGSTKRVFVIYVSFKETNITNWSRSRRRTRPSSHTGSLMRPRPPTRLDTLIVAGSVPAARFGLLRPAPALPPGETVNVMFETGADAVILCQSVAAGDGTFSCPLPSRPVQAQDPTPSWPTGKTSGTKASTLFLVTS